VPGVFNVKTDFLAAGDGVTVDTTPFTSAGFPIVVHGAHSLASGNVAT